MANPPDNADRGHGLPSRVLPERNGCMCGSQRATYTNITDVQIPLKGTMTTLSIMGIMFGKLMIKIGLKSDIYS